jgi:rhodanese-related sulfurtransferase
MTAIKSKCISPADLSTMLASGHNCRLLDVRTPAEYARCHVPQAELFPLRELKVEDILSQHRGGTPIYVLCQEGMRASKAIEQFERAGCRDCVLVEGGTQAWVEAGLPVNNGHSAVIPLMRQVQIVVGALATIGAVLAFSVSRWFAVLPIVLGCGLLFAGLTGTCGLAMMLARMPWNRIKDQSSCTLG